MATSDLGLGFVLNVLAHLMIVGLYLLTRKEIGKWAEAGAAYAVVSVIQIMVMFVAPGIATVGGVIFATGTQGNPSSWAAVCAFLALAHGLIDACLMAVIYERTTGISLWTGKPGKKGAAKVTPGGSIKGRNLPEVIPVAIPIPIQRMPRRQPGPGPEAERKFRLPRWTWKATLYLAAAAGLAVAAWLSSNPLLYFPACAVAVLLVVEYSIDLYAALQITHIEVRREVPAVVGEDDLVEVKLILENRGSTVNNLVLVDNFAPEEKAYRERKVMVGRLPGKSTGSYSYEVNCWRRGVWRVGPLELRRESPMAVFKNRSKRLESSLVRVHPHLYPAPSWTLALGGPRERVGLGNVDKAGWSSEFYGVREYRPGDPRRLIHWPSTARCMTLMVKELEMAADFDLTVVFDLNRLAVTGAGKHTTFEYMIKIMGSICRDMLRKCHALNLVALGQGMRVLKCSRGMMDFPLVMDFLTDLQAEGMVPLELSLTHLQSQLKKGSTLILPLQRPNVKMVEILSFLRAQGTESRVLLFDSSSFQPAPFPAKVKEVEQSAYLNTLEELRKHSFRVAGVDREKGPSQAVFFGGWG